MIMHGNFAVEDQQDKREANFCCIFVHNSSGQSSGVFILLIVETSSVFISSYSAIGLRLSPSQVHNALH